MYRTLDVTYSPQTIFGQADMGQNCWTWQGSLYINGYGKIGRRGYMAHRLAYELTKGDVPEDMCLDHLCSNRACIKPEHLEIVTLAENIRRGKSFAGINLRKTHCRQGHEFTLANIYIPPKRPNRRYCKKCMTERDHQYKLRTLTLAQA